MTGIGNRSVHEINVAYALYIILCTMFLYNLDADTEVLHLCPLYTLRVESSRKRRKCVLRVVIKLSRWIWSRRARADDPTRPLLLLYPAITA